MANRGRPSKRPGAGGAPHAIPDPWDPNGTAEIELPAPAAEAIASIADRAERAKLLSELLRDPHAKGAERVAAARLLEAMEATADDGTKAGPPKPTTRPEQVARLVRMMTCAGAHVRDDALGIIESRHLYAGKRIRELGPQPTFPTFTYEGEQARAVTNIELHQRGLGPEAPDIGRQLERVARERDERHAARPERAAESAALVAPGDPGDDDGERDGDPDA